MLVVLKTLFEYRTAECRLDLIDILACTAFCLSLDGDFYTAELLCHIDRFMCHGVKTRYFTLEMHFDKNISQVSKTGEIIINTKNCKF